MIKVKVIEEFTLKKFDELKNIVRAGKEEKGKLFVKDIFECDEKMAKYLTNETQNPVNRAVVEVIEVIPEEKAVKKTATKKTTAKKTTKKA